MLDAANMSVPVHVIVGVIIKDAQVCITYRHPELHQGDMWEFPGGKLELNESPFDALVRELKEEINIDVKQAEPLMKLDYAYPDKHVLLDIWQVTDFAGEPHGQQGQALKWQPLSALDASHFPAANRAIVTALNLPQNYVITPECDEETAFLEHLETTLKQDQKLIQLRCKSLDKEGYRKLAIKAVELCHRYGARLLLNADVNEVNTVQADGVHLTSKQLMATRSRPLSKNSLVAASVHHPEELIHAISIDVDFVVIAPVLKTTSHPDATPLGWEGLKTLVAQSSTVVYALGGMNPSQLNEARKAGAYGVAGISGFWPGQIGT